MRVIISLIWRADIKCMDISWLLEDGFIGYHTSEHVGDEQSGWLHCGTERNNRWARTHAGYKYKTRVISSIREIWSHLPFMHIWDQSKYWLLWSKRRIASHQETQQKNKQKYRYGSTISNHLIEYKGFKYQIKIKCFVSFNDSLKNTGQESRT